jgi:pyridoxine 5-phosphate synthase
MTHLSVNVNKVATIRNSRGKNNPDLIKTALRLVSFGAHGITVHPRPDGRHILWNDVSELKNLLKVELNVEGYPSFDFIEQCTKIRPAQCTLVPDASDALTSNAGWRLQGHESLLKSSIQSLRDLGSRVSLFIDPFNTNVKELIAFRDMGADRIELYTESFAESFLSQSNLNAVVEEYKKLSELAHSMGFGVNAGHDLNKENLKYFLEKVPFIAEVSIGHALVCDALELGWRETMKQYLSCLKE